MTETSATRALVLPTYVLALFATGLLLREAAPLFLWILCSFFTFVLLDRPAEHLKQRGWPVALSSTALVLIATAVIGGTLYLLGHLLAGLIQELEQSRRVFMDSYQDLSGYWNSINQRLTAVFPNAGAHEGISKVEIVEPSPLGGEVGGAILHGVGSAVSVATFTILIPVLAFFLLAERDVLARVILRAHADHARPRRAWGKIIDATWAYFFGNLLIAVVTYPLFAGLLRMFGVPSIWVTAALAAFLNLVPFAGAVLAGFLPAVALYSQTASAAGPLALYAACMAVHFVVADFITPKVLGKRLNINATTSTISLVAWGELWGGVGLLLAIPITSVSKICFEHSDVARLNWIANLMSEDADRALNAECLTTPSRAAERTMDA